MQNDDKSKKVRTKKQKRQSVLARAGIITLPIKRVARHKPTHPL